MRTKLAERVQSGELLLWQPHVQGDPCERTLFITSEINDEFDEDTWLDMKLAHRYAQLGADFDRFVTGETLPIGMDPYDKDDAAFMARIDPVEYGIWSLRSVAPRPAIRVLGAFCEKDVFVALITRRRADLGGRGSVEWMRAREDAIARWADLFGDCPRLLGDEENDFFSEKTFVV